MEKLANDLHAFPISLEAILLGNNLVVIMN